MTKCKLRKVNTVSIMDHFGMPCMVMTEILFIACRSNFVYKVLEK